MRDVARRDPDYLAWMLNGDFAADVKEIARSALRKEFPQRKPLGVPHHDFMVGTDEAACYGRLRTQFPITAINKMIRPTTPSTAG